ncbi:MAG: chorismate synthase [Bacteroidales bacterium]|nr:chorismate synthase [Bacteroidales bacterium]
MVQQTTDTFGMLFTLTDWGDTHGDALEGRIEGCPAGIYLDQDFIQTDLNRRAPCSEALSTRRREPDTVSFLSGVDERRRTTGEPILFRIPNRDVRVIEENRHVIRPSHSSYTYFKKYGYMDNELCGRASARQTVCRVVAGAIAKLVLKPYGITFGSEVLRTGMPARDGDSVGAVVRGHIRHLPAGLGEPVYNKFSAQLAFAMMSINAAKGFEIGCGFHAAEMCGSEYNDLQNPDFSFRTNHDGGVQAGITNGQDVWFSVAFKPIPSVRFDQPSIDFEGNPAILKGSDRNDLCVVPRVLPVVEAMAAIVTVNALLMSQQSHHPIL